MSWSSEFEPDSNRPSEQGRSLSFPEDKKSAYRGPETTQDFARNTLRLTTEPEIPKTSGPSRGLVVATVALAAVALVSGLVFLSSSGGEQTETASTSSSETSTSTDRSLNDLVGGFDTTRIAFEPGTARFTPDGLAALEELRSAVAADPEASLAFDIRTYSQDSPADNHRLSIEQAQIITEFVLENNNIDESQISARGLGAADINAGDHLSHFVTISLPGASRSIQNSIAETSGFAFAADPGQWPTEIPEGSALDSVVTLIEEEQADVEILINTFEDQPADGESDADSSDSGEAATEPNSRLAGFSNRTFMFEASGPQIGDSILQLLTASGVDASAVSIIQATEGVQVPSGVNNVISVTSGESASAAQTIEAITEVRFVPGEATLDSTGRNALDDVAAVLTDSTETLIVNVHTFSQQTAEDNELLSVAQAEAAVAYLEEQGIPATRLRAVGSGNSNQFDESDRLTLTVLTIAQ